LPNDIETVALPPAVNKSDLNKWRRSSARWVRRLPGWGPETRGTPSTLAKPTSDCPSSSELGKRKTPLQDAYDLYPLQSSDICSTRPTLARLQLSNQ
jgi:hypothetical protein